jgi:poly-gamma-glutamate synthesis protein (capsule biosynthesis protein)
VLTHSSWPLRSSVGAALAVLITVALTGCSAVEQELPGASPVAVPTPEELSPSAKASAALDLTLAFAGDVHFTGRTAGLLAHPDTAFGPISSVLSAADFSMVNFETAVTARGTAQPKTFHFRAAPAGFTAIRAAGVDVVTMANNHVLDYGQVGLADTLAAAGNAHFPYVGIGATANAAWAPYLTQVKGKWLAVLGVSQVAELADSWVATPTRPGEAHAIDLNRTLAAVREAKEQADVVIVYMHWGTEGESCPDADQKALAAKLAGAGADIIIGAHAHVLQGSGWLGKTFVAYGMGNFVWWMNSYSTETGVLRLTLHPDTPLTADFVPAVVSGTGQPVVATGAAGTRIAQRYAGLRACAGLAAASS